MTTDISSKNIGGVSDLVVWAPIRDGFIDAFENITFESRLKLTAEALHKLRVSAREHELIAPFPDTAERILSLLDFRIGFIDGNMFSLGAANAPGSTPYVRPRRYMYLVATFDNPWEPYMRLIYDPLGPFLDLLLCNCEGYKLSQDVGFAEYAAWVRAHQIDSSIFYATTGLTVRDQIYLAKLEKVQREHEPAEADRLIAGLTHDFPEALAEKVRRDPVSIADSIRLGFEALTVLFRLADYYPADRLSPAADGAQGDGRLLLRVAQDLLTGWLEALAMLGRLNPPLRAALEQVYAEPLAWFTTVLSPPLPQPAEPVLDPTEVQAGILTSYDMIDAPVTHGALLLMQTGDPAGARRFIDGLAIDWEGGDAPADGIFHNIAFTFEGLKRLGLDQAQLDAFPKEFRAGSVDRAPLIGDIRENHPRRWHLPRHSWPYPRHDGDPPNTPVDLTEIDFVLQLRLRPLSIGATREFVDLAKPARAIMRQMAAGATEAATEAQADDPLAAEIARLADQANAHGVTLLTVESMVRTEPATVPPRDPALPSGVVPTIDHFGFVDSISQPALSTDGGVAPRDVVKLGDLLCGYGNSQRDAGGAGSVDPLQFNGSFLVIRKMPQDRKALDDFIARATTAFPDLDEEIVAASIVGRRRDGSPLIAPATGNDFDFAGDPHGEQCPLAAHVRRANPRDTFQGRPTPRILRRGMSYGPRYAGPADADTPRGVMFMAYNASIAEQYEVIQRWLNRGNSTGIAGAQNDPLVGIGMEAGPRTFRFVAKDAVRRLTIDKPFVGLDWTMYLFVPARTALARLSAPRTDLIAPIGSVANGAALIARIDMLDDAAKHREWKRLLEDFISKDPAERGDGPDVWAAIRAAAADGGHDGVLVVPGTSTSGAAAAPVTDPADPTLVLVAAWPLIEQVLSDAASYSVCVQGSRVAQSFGDIYVAMDPHLPDGRYERESTDTNEIIWQYSEYDEDDAFDAAYRFTEDLLVGMKRFAADLGRASFKLELRRELLMPALGNLCSYWFDIPDIEPVAPAGEYIERGGWGWETVDDSGTATPASGRRKPRCPGDFMAPSRYSFYPEPTEAIAAYGRAHGRALRAAAPHIIAKKRRDGNVTGVISQKMYAVIHDDDVLARNLIGIMEGMLPPTDGMLRGILYEWLDQKTLWRHQGALHRAAKGGRAGLAAARAALLAPIEAAMCKRPAPDLIYRTALRDTVLAGKVVKRGSRVVLSLVSAMQASLDTGPDVTPVFGGCRRKANQDEGEPAHACPARKMVMASVMGILSALLDSGRITAQPASLIVEISEYPPPQPTGVASPTGAA